MLFGPKVQPGSSGTYRIVFAMVNGQQFSVSGKIYGGKGEALREQNDASAQLSCIMENLMYFTADDGTIVMTKHVITARIERIS